MNTTTLAALPPTPTADQLKVMKSARMVKHNHGNGSFSYLTDALLKHIFDPKWNDYNERAKRVAEEVVDLLYGKPLMDTLRAILPGWLSAQNRTYEIHLDPKPSATTIYKLPLHKESVLVPAFSIHQFPNPKELANISAEMWGTLAALVNEHNKLADAWNQLESTLRNNLRPCTNLAQAVAVVPDLFELLGYETLINIVRPPAPKPKQELVSKEVSCLIGKALGVQREGCE
jgi:hypothetical protein